MKKNILIIVIIMGYINNVNAQYVEAAKAVLSFAKKSKEEMITEELKKINRKLETANKESVLNKIANLKQQEYLSIAEDFLLKVDDYVKKGKEINEIYDREEMVLLKMKELERIYSQYFSGLERKNIRQTTGNVLQKTGDLVDLAMGLVSDNNYRLTSEERRNYLKEVLSDLARMERILDEQIYVAKQYILYKEREKEEIKMRNEYEKDFQRKQQILNNM